MMSGLSVFSLHHYLFYLSERSQKPSSNGMLYMDRMLLLHQGIVFPRFLQQHTDKELSRMDLVLPHLDPFRN